MTAPKKLCVIGWPVSHSKSPLIHNAMISALGLNYKYLCQPVRPGELAAFLDRAKAEGYAGFNATMPFKEELLPYLDALDPLAAKLGAVNTVCIKDGKLYGYNTDCPGYVAALRGVGFDPAGKRALLLGAGGAAKAVALGLVEAGAAVTIANRTAEKAAALAAPASDVMSTVHWAPDALSRAAGEADLLVNCTSLGMAGQGEFGDLSFLEALPQGALVSDLIYHPLETALLRAARALGHPTVNGLPLLMHQAILALEHFTGRDLDAAAMAALLEPLLREA